MPQQNSHAADDYPQAQVLYASITGPLELSCTQNQKEVHPDFLISLPLFTAGSRTMLDGIVVVVLLQDLHTDGITFLKNVICVEIPIYW